MALEKNGHYILDYNIKNMNFISHLGFQGHLPVPRTQLESSVHSLVRMIIRPLSKTAITLLEMVFKDCNLLQKCNLTTVF